MLKNDYRLENLQENDYRLDNLQEADVVKLQTLLASKITCELESFLEDQTLDVLCARLGISANEGSEGFLLASTQKRWAWRF